jgi:hypothetical protein
MPAADLLSTMAQFVPSQPLLAHGLYFSPGEWLLLVLMLLGPFILAGILTLVAVVVWFYSRRAAVVCLLLAGVWLLVGHGVVSNNCEPGLVLWYGGLASLLSFFVIVFLFAFHAKTESIRERRAHWAAAVAQDPETLRAIGISRDQDLQLVRTTTRLRELSISNCGLTSRQLVYLEGLSQVERLQISNTLVDDIGLRHIARLAELRELDLSDNYNINGEGLCHLTALTHLEKLSFSRCWLEDTAIEAIAVMTQLRELDLSGCRSITDRSRKHLQRLTGLQALNLTRTSVTGVEIERLQQELPRCNIAW